MAKGERMVGTPSALFQEMFEYLGYLRSLLVCQCVTVVFIVYSTW